MEKRIALLHAFADIPRPLLEALAKASGVTLASAGIAPVAPPPPVARPPNLQMIVDDAIREAAEALDLPPRALRPVLGRVLERLADGGVPVAAAARMALAAAKPPKPE
jgi:hypothetical protein